MFRFITRSCVVVVLVLSLLATTPLAYAESGYGKTILEDEVSGEEMILDLVLLRPVGFVATVIGAAAFVVSLPFTIPLKQVEEAAKKMVVKPGKYTFTRRLGYDNK